MHDTTPQKERNNDIPQPAASAGPGRDTPVARRRPHPDPTRPAVEARFHWHGRQLDVRGVLAPDFLISQGRVLLRLDDVQPALPGDEATAVWVPAPDVQPIMPASSGQAKTTAARRTSSASSSSAPSFSSPCGDKSNDKHHADAKPASLLLRSSMHELPAGQSRDYALRTLSVTLSQFVAEGGRRISLSPSVADMIEWHIVIDVPVRPEAAPGDIGDGTRQGASRAWTGSDLSPQDALPPGTDIDLSAEGGLSMETGVDYLWKFHMATRPGTARRAMWSPPAPAFAERNLDPEDRARAAHYVGQLPLWLTTRRFWSVYRWHDNRLQHIVQFSLPASLRRALTRRFRLHTV